MVPLKTSAIPFFLPSEDVLMSLNNLLIAIGKDNDTILNTRLSSIVAASMGYDIHQWVLFL